MYALYWSPGAASLSVHWMLLELGVDHELVRVDLETNQHKTAAYRRLNPTGLVPTLVIDDRPYFESSALLMMLAERHPEAAFEPDRESPDRGDYLQWMIHLANALQPAFRAWFYPDDIAGAANALATKAGARRQIEAIWDRIEAHLGDGRPYMAGSDVSALDFQTTMLMRWSRAMPKPATEWPAIGEYVTRMKARPTFAKLYELQGLTDWT